jgi:pimeloyl-ACP methyl ester carboxylesterase
MFVDSSSWDRVVSRLSAHRRLLVVDGPGYGGSDPLTRVTDMAECALAAGDLLDGLGITEPVDWVGNAWGGHVGYQLIGTQPARIRSLVAVSAPTTPLPDSDRKTLRMLSRVVRLLGPIGPLRAKIADAQLTDASRRNDPHALAVIDGSLGRTTRESLANTLLSFIVGRDDLSEQAARGLVPYLFVASDDRGEWTPEQAVAAAERCVDAEVVVIPGARTLIPVEQPDALAEAVLDFWAAGSDDAARSEE